MVDPVVIGSRKIGAGYPCFVIGEAGVNHNGRLDMAKQLIDAGRRARVDAVKFQTWRTEKLVTRTAPKAAYQEDAAGKGGQYDMLKALELSYDDFRDLQAYASSQGVLFLSTPDEEDSADFLERLDVPAIKIGSAEVTNLPFLSHVAGKRRPVILSTGMATLDEVRAAVSCMEKAGNTQLILLQCVSNYPADPRDCNLRAMSTLRDAFGYPVGFSDHTRGVDVALAAVALGACVIEKHFTLDRNLPGPDHAASLAPEELADFVGRIRGIEGALGSGEKVPALSEADTRAAVRKKIVAIRDVRAGDPISRSDFSLLRAAGGMEPVLLSSIVGRIAKTRIAAGTTLTPDMLE